MTDRYDPNGEAAIWSQAAELVMGLTRDDPDPQVQGWNIALEQAARLLDNEARGVRQRNGMYMRAISGQWAGKRPMKADGPIGSDGSIGSDTATAGHTADGSARVADSLGSVGGVEFAQDSDRGGLIDKQH